jgi:hypothetical protein
MSRWLSPVECMAEGETEDLVKKELILNTLPSFACPFTSPCRAL